MVGGHLALSLHSSNEPVNSCNGLDMPINGGIESVLPSVKSL